MILQILLVCKTITVNVVLTKSETKYLMNFRCDLGFFDNNYSCRIFNKNAGMDNQAFLRQKVT